MLVIFAFDSTRYFTKFHSHSLKPYIAFQIYMFKTFEKVGFLTTDSEKMLVLDESKAHAAIDVFVDIFESILDCMDRSDAAGLEHVLNVEMIPESDLVKHVVSKVL